MRIKDVETMKRCFNESDLFASSVDLTRTPMRLLQGQLRTPQRLAASPIPEADSEGLLSSQMTSREGSHCSTPRNVNNEDDGSSDHDVTLYEDICSEKKKASDSRLITRSEDDIAIVGVRSESVGEANIVEEFVEGEKWKTTLPDVKDEDDDQVYQEFKSVKRRKEKRRESIISNIFINLTNILDV